MEEKSGVYLDSQVETLFWETESDPLGQMSGKPVLTLSRGQWQIRRETRGQVATLADWPGCFCREGGLQGAKVDTGRHVRMLSCGPDVRDGVLDSAGSTGGGRRDGILGLR